MLIADVLVLVAALCTYSFAPMGTTFKASTLEAYYRFLYEILCLIFKIITVALKINNCRLISFSTANDEDATAT